MSAPNDSTATLTYDQIRAEASLVASIADDRVIAEVLDEREGLLVRGVLQALSKGGMAAARADGKAHVREALQRLLMLWRSIDAFPRMHGFQKLGERKRDLETLLDTFSKAEPYTVEAYLPTRAVLARAYGMARFNFCRMVGYVVDQHLEVGEEKERLWLEAQAAGRAAAATLVAEDVLRSIACDTTVEELFRREATRILAALWDQRATQSVADFAPLLDSAWRAKAGVEICYGTLVGVSETLKMLFAGLDPDFVATFSAEFASVEQYSAFEEFLFNTTYEQLKRMREFMANQRQSLLDPPEVAALFGVDVERLHCKLVRPSDVFFTFREREMGARIRRVRGLEGPKKTAEEYVMISVLARQVES